MNKKNIFRMMAVAAFAGIAVMSCDNSAPKMDSKADTKAAPSELKIAYVEVDSIMTQYKFCKEYSEILQKKGQNIQNTLASKQQQLQAAGVNFQQKLQQNAYTREQAEAIQAGLQKQAADLDALNSRLSNEFQVETNKFNDALMEKYKQALARLKAMDPNEQLLNYYNKAYKKSKRSKRWNKHRRILIILIAFAVCVSLLGILSLFE